MVTRTTQQDAFRNWQCDPARVCPVSTGVPTCTMKELGELIFVAAFASMDLLGFLRPTGPTLLPTLANKEGVHRGQAGPECFHLPTVPLFWAG